MGRYCLCSVYLRSQQARVRSYPVFSFTRNPRADQNIGGEVYWTYYAAIPLSQISMFLLESVISSAGRFCGVVGVLTALPPTCDKAESHLLRLFPMKVSSGISREWNRVVKIPAMRVVNSSAS